MVIGPPGSSGRSVVPAVGRGSSHVTGHVTTHLQPMGAGRVMESPWIHESASSGSVQVGSLTFNTMAFKIGINMQLNLFNIYFDIKTFYYIMEIIIRIFLSSNFNF